MAVACPSPRAGTGHAKQTRLPTRSSALTRGRRRRKIAGTSDFVVEHDRINMADPEVFSRDPVNLIRLFHLADRHDLAFHPDAMKAVTRSLKLIDADLREDATANKLFLELLSSRNQPETVLRRMTEAGGLGRFASPEAAVGAVVEVTPAGRLGARDDRADAVVFLASGASRFIAGAGLPVDGGMGM